MRIHLSKIKRGARHYLSMKAARKKLGLTGKSRHIRQLKRGIKSLKSDVKSVLSPTQSTSATTFGYQHQPRTLSQLTGGV